MKKILAILFILAGFSFLIWKFLFLTMGFFPSLLLNILGFIPITIGFAFLKSPKGREEIQPEQKEEKMKIPESGKIINEHVTEDHSKYMPK